jgi:hypothetical protein
MPTPLDRYHNQRQKGRRPPLGTLGAVYDAMPPTSRQRLLDSIEPHDRALSDTVARLLEMALAPRTDPRR